MKKAIAFVLATILMLTAILPVSATEVYFPDVEGHWAESYIEQWASMGVINGYGDGTFRPDQLITRAEVAKILALSYAMEMDVEPTAFADVTEDAWYYDYVQACAHAEIVGGYPDGTFLPNNSITRSEAVKMVCLAAGLSEQETGTEGFVDAAQIPDWSVGYWNALYKAGVIHGYEDGTLRPVQYITRAEMIKILCVVYSELKIYELEVSIADNLGNIVTDSTSYLTGDSCIVEVLIPLLVANRNNFAAAFPSEHMRILLDEGVALATEGYADGWTEEELAAWQNYVVTSFSEVGGDSSAIEYISDVDSTVNTMKMNVGYTAQFYDTDIGRENIQYTVTITCNIMD